MKNKLSDLNNHLFSQLERLNNEDLKGEDLMNEIERGKAIAAVSNQVINAAKVAVDAIRLVAAGHVHKEDIPLLIESK